MESSATSKTCDSGQDKIALLRDELALQINCATGSLSDSEARTQDVGKSIDIENSLREAHEHVREGRRFVAKAIEIANEALLLGREVYDDDWVKKMEELLERDSSTAGLRWNEGIAPSDVHVFTFAAEQTQNWVTNSEHFGQQAHPISIATCPLISRSTAYQDAKALVGAMNRSFNFPTLDDSFPINSYFTADVDREIATASRIVTYTSTLDEAIYRSTWKFQALLDKNNVSIELQESILAILFGPDAPRMLPDGRMDYRDMSLGSLLRYAGREYFGPGTYSM
ncbi:hypothetical protein R1sor_019444 [Riccia sorocarpa]|uniref:Uncharacterized protein n=1 Tax=Riccia sorocarpa TaxID=122646 RepID=A0ABD3IF90_9MARC